MACAWVMVEPPSTASAVARPWRSGPPGLVGWAAPRR